MHSLIGSRRGQQEFGVDDVADERGGCVRAVEALVEVSDPFFVVDDEQQTIESADPGRADVHLAVGEGLLGHVHHHVVDALALRAVDAHGVGQAEGQLDAGQLEGRRILEAEVETDARDDDGAVLVVQHLGDHAVLVKPLDAHAGVGRQSERVEVARHQADVVDFQEQLVVRYLCVGEITLHLGRQDGGQDAFGVVHFSECVARDVGAPGVVRGVELNSRRTSLLF